MKIKLLPEDVVLRIRAGEVIERPAQAVKELVENALDAGARTIKVCLEGGGRTMLCVHDDGSGMDASDLLMCTQRHATSKLDAERDISTVDTYGFRGEALAALSAVAQLRVESRTRDGECGWRLEAGGEPIPCSRPRGSTLVVARDLFALHPARAAFLKSARAELAAVKDVVESAALAQPGVAWVLESDGRTILDLPATTPDGRACAIMGRDFSDNSLAFETCVDGVGVWGRLAVPGWSGHGTCGQRFVVNNRPVRDRVLAAAVRTAYSDSSGRVAPGCVVHISLPTGQVDANVHPAKTEVRFRNPSTLGSLVCKVLRDCLGGPSQGPAQALGLAAAQAARPVCVDAPHHRERLPLGRAMGVVMGGYAVCEGLGGLILVDLHAAAERAAYEKLMAQCLAGGIASRPLANPVVVKTLSHVLEGIEENGAAWLQLGIVVQALDHDNAMVLAMPDFVPDATASGLAHAIVAGLETQPHADPGMALLQSTCSLLACHAAYRFGDEIEPGQLDAMLREFETTPRISTCMHGRPTIVELPRAGLQRLFQR